MCLYSVYNTSTAYRQLVHIVACGVFLDLHNGRLILYDDLDDLFDISGLYQRIRTNRPTPVLYGAAKLRSQVNTAVTYNDDEDR